MLTYTVTVEAERVTAAAVRVIVEADKVTAAVRRDVIVTVDGTALTVTDFVVVTTVEIVLDGHKTLQRADAWTWAMREKKASARCTETSVVDVDETIVPEKFKETRV